MTSEKVSESERRQNTPVPKEILSYQEIPNTEETGKTIEMTEKSVRRKIAMFEVIGTTDLPKYNSSQERANKELSNFKIESIRRNFHHETSLPVPIIQLPPAEQKIRKTSDSFLVNKKAIFDPCLTVDEKSASNEEIAKSFSPEEDAINVRNVGAFIRVQNDENSVSQTTLTSSTGEMEESAEPHSTEQKSKEEECKLEMESFEFDSSKLLPGFDDMSLVISKEKMSSSSEVSRHSTGDERSIQDGDCNVSMMTNGSSSSDGTYVSISVQVRSKLFAQNRNSDTSSGDYKCAVSPSIEPIYDRTLTDQESSSSSNSAVLRRPSIVKVLQKQDEQIKRPSSWHLGISESEHHPGKFVRRQRRHSLSISSTKSSIFDHGRDANSQPVIPSTLSTDDSWSGSEFNNDSHLSTTSESSRSRIYDADDDESNPYDRPQQYFSENPYDIPSPTRQRSETTNTITRLFEPDSIDEIPEHSDADGTEIVRQMSPTQTMPQSPKSPPIPARKWKERDSSSADESSGEKVASHSSDSRKPSNSSSTSEDRESLKRAPLHQPENRSNQRPITYTTQLSYQPPKKESRRARKLSLNPIPSASAHELLESEPKKVSKYKKMLFPFKRSTSLATLSKQIDDACTCVEFESSASFEGITIEPTSPGKSPKGIGKKFMRLMKGSKKS